MKAPSAGRDPSASASMALKGSSPGSTSKSSRSTAARTSATRVFRLSISVSSSPHTVMTTFPRACPSSRYRMASGTSASGYVLSMTGVIFPDSMSSLRTIRSS